MLGGMPGSLPGDHQGEIESWEQLIGYLHRLAAAQRTVHIHFGAEESGRPYVRLEGRLHHARTEPDGDEWFVVGDTAPDPGDLGGPWNYVRLPRGRYAAASIETIDGDDYFGIIVRFGDEIIRVTDPW
jgi:hypothetical protein